MGWARNYKGFTIVELLIVIVVIGILAAVVIVSYNGVIGKAEESRFLSTVDTFEKALRMYQAKEGVNVSTDTRPDTLYFACLGEGYPQTSQMDEGVCYSAVPTSGAPSVIGRINTAVNNDLKGVLSTLPQVDYSVRVIPNGSSTIYIRGIMYESVINSPPALLYIIPRDDSCGRGVKSVSEATPGIATCTVTLP
ncbi:MAG: type II secretion system protein [Candidatus Microsaccharimonas sp.]